MVRKKWVTHMRPAEIASAAKTTRTVRCIVKDSKMCLQYAHQVCCCSLCVHHAAILTSKTARECSLTRLSSLAC